MERVSKSSECSTAKWCVVVVAVDCMFFRHSVCTVEKPKKYLQINEYLLCATQSADKCVSASITWNYFQVDPFSCSLRSSLLPIRRYVHNEIWLFCQVCSILIFFFCSNLSSCKHDARLTPLRCMLSLAHMVFAVAINSIVRLGGACNCNEVQCFFLLVLGRIHFRLLAMRGDIYHIVQFICAQPHFSHISILIMMLKNDCSCFRCALLFALDFCTVC